MGTERQAETGRERQREAERGRERERARERGRESERKRQRERQRERETETAGESSARAVGRERRGGTSATILGNAGIPPATGHLIFIPLTFESYHQQSEVRSGGGGRGGKGDGVSSVV